MEKRTYPPHSRRTARRILAENLRLIRFHRQVPQEELAGIVGLDRTYLGCVDGRKATSASTTSRRPRSPPAFQSLIC